MSNTINLHDSQQYYEVNYNGKAYRCNRVTNVIESTQPMPYQLQKWMVNCAVSKLQEINKIPNQLTLKELNQIAWDAHKDYSKQALAIGSEVHASINSHTQPESEEAKACFRGYTDFLKDFIPVKLASELTIYDTSNLIAGTIDCLALKATDKGKRKKLYLIDWKTSSSIQESYLMQVSVYKWMFQSFMCKYHKNASGWPISLQNTLDTITDACGKKPSIQAIVVRLRKDLVTVKNPKTTYELKEVSKAEEKRYLSEFKLMLKLTNQRRKHGNSTGKE